MFIHNQQVIIEAYLEILRFNSLECIFEYVIWHNLERHESIKQHLGRIFTGGKNALLTLNVYAKRNNNMSASRLQIISTRLYLGFLLSAALILVLVTGLDQRIKTVVITMPSVAKFENLFNTQQSTLSCPCSNVAITHSKFFSLTPTLHQICSSDFLSDDWLDRLVHSSPWQSTPYYYLDIRSYGLNMFRAIRTLCSVVNATIMNALTTFNNTQLITTQTLSRQQFQSQVQILITEFQLNTPYTFKQLMHIAREFINGNQLLTITVSNFYARIKFDSSDSSLDWQIYLGIKLSQNDTFPSCSCLLDTCSQPLGFFNWNDSSVSYTLVLTVPGMWSACYPLDGLRMSTLECWFNETCISLIRAHLIPVAVEQYIPALEFNKQKRFTPSTSLGDIIEELMIEEWSNATNYEAYYMACRPLTCTYTYFHRLDWLYTVTTLISLFGGLSISFRMICTLLVRYYARLYTRFTQRRTIAPSSKLLYFIQIIAYLGINIILSNLSFLSIKIQHQVIPLMCNFHVSLGYKVLY